MRKSLLGTLFLIILAIAAYTRLSNNDWDTYHHYHPDERFIAWVGTTIEWPTSLQTAFNPTDSSINPYYWAPEAETEGVLVFQDEPRRFAYGHLPLYLGVATLRIAEYLAPLADMLPADTIITRFILNGDGQVEYDHFVAAARVLTALLDLGTITFTFMLGRWLYSDEVGLLAAAFLAVNVMHIQLAHFFTVDPFTTFFVVATLYFLVTALPRGELQPKRGRAYWAAIAFGLAIGSKFSAIYLIFPFLIYVRFTGSWREPQTWRHLGGLLFVSMASFFVTNPFVFLDWNCATDVPAFLIGPLRTPAFSIGNCYVENIVRQQSMVSGASDVGFTRQYSNTTPFIYYIVMQLKWGMGLLLGLAAFIGFGGALARGGWWLIARRPIRLAQIATRIPEWLQPHEIRRGELILLAWAIPYFVTNGLFFVKFMRYMQPLVPLLMLFAAALILRIRSTLTRNLTAGTVLLVTAIYAFGFMNLYESTHPWDAASFWIFDNVPADSLILDEQWDDLVPTSQQLDDGTFLSRTQYRNDSLTWLTGPDERDTVSKLNANVARLAAADYLVIASNRIYGVIPRISERYPISGQYHELLFTEQLGYELVYFAGRGPNWNGYHLWPDPFAGLNLTPPAEVDAFLSATGFRFGSFDESFTVYDQPLVMVWQNTGRFSTEEILAQFDYE